MLSLLNFSNLFLKLASSYSKLLEQIEEKGKQNPKPFNYLFNGQDRIYLPFIKSSEVNLSEDDQKVIKILEVHGFNDIDYIGGYATSVDGRKFKIASALSKIENKLIKQSDDLDKVKKIKVFFENLLNIFTFSNNRKVTNYKDLTVVISQNAIDIATMSTDRPWSSCMNLKKEKSFSVNRIFCEVSDGGLVAYLINKHDVEIQKPLARIWIRRFVNNLGESYAVPEEKIYGNAPAEFYKFVKNWLEENQIYIEGEMSLSGSSWSDTFTSKDYYNAPDYISEEEFKSLDFKRKEDPKILIKIINNIYKYTKEFIEENIIPKFLDKKNNLQKYPKEYYKLFKFLPENHYIYNILLSNSFLLFFKENKDIKESNLIYEELMQKNIDKVNSKNKNTLKELILDYNKNGLDKISELEVVTLFSYLTTSLKLCSESEFNELINVLYFIKAIPNINATIYNNYLIDIFQIINERNIINYKILSILKNDIINIFNESTSYDKNKLSTIVNLMQKSPEKFKFMKQEIISKFKNLQSKGDTLDLLYSNKLEKILEKM